MLFNNILPLDTIISVVSGTTAYLFIYSTNTSVLGQVLFQADGRRIHYCTAPHMLQVSCSKHSTMLSFSTFNLPSAAYTHQPRWTKGHSFHTLVLSCLCLLRPLLTSLLFSYYSGEILILSAGPDPVFFIKLPKPLNKIDLSFPYVSIYTFSVLLF